MSEINQVVLEGNVTRDAEVFPCKNGSILCKIGIAVNEYRRNEIGGFDEDPSFFDVVTFGKVAERCKTECTKGRGVRVTGRLKQDRYVDKGGNKRSKVVIIADNVDFKPRRKSAAAPRSAPRDSGDAGAASVPPLP